jgi:hypothetical protein
MFPGDAAVSDSPCSEQEAATGEAGRGRRTAGGGVSRVTDSSGPRPQAGALLVPHWTVPMPPPVDWSSMEVKALRLPAALSSVGPPVGGWPWVTSTTRPTPRGAWMFGMPNSAHKALVIGVNTYGTPGRDASARPASDSPEPGVPAGLRQCIHDACDMGCLLARKGYAVTLVLDPCRAALWHELRAFAHSLASGGTAVVYFSGHGASTEGVNVVMPTDANVQGRCLCGMMHARRMTAPIIALA